MNIKEAQANGVHATMCMAETPEGEWVQYKDIQHIIEQKELSLSEIIDLTRQYTDSTKFRFIMVKDQDGN